jgi:hypothetical protein
MRNKDHKLTDEAMRLDASLVAVADKLSAMLVGQLRNET